FRGEIWQFEARELANLSPKFAVKTEAIFKSLIYNNLQNGRKNGSFCQFFLPISIQVAIFMSRRFKAPEWPVFCLFFRIKNADIHCCRITNPAGRKLWMPANRRKREGFCMYLVEQVAIKRKKFVSLWSKTKSSANYAISEEHRK
ncbi:MAG: hypothetical protein IKD78_09065, partial [Bacteroidales bacterium]|nr:hypothetical protein [Bacteroidales bacterium]